MLRRSFLRRCASATAAIALAKSTSNLDRHQKSSPCGSFDDWRSVQNQFSITDDRIYLNTGGLGPAPNPVLAAQFKTIRALQTAVNHGHQLIEKARPVVADFVGCDPDELAFTRNATEGNSTIASGLNLQPGDEIIIDSHAHQGGSLAWMTRQNFEGIVVKVFEPDAKSVNGNMRRIEELITERTRVIQVSHVTAPTGIRMPVVEIGQLARKHNIWFHVDGAQSLGMFSFRFSGLNCDSFAACCHKWLCGPQGTGILIVRREKLDEVIPTEVGSYADADWQLPNLLEYVPSARRFECGTRDAAAIVGVAEAVCFLDQIGMDCVFEYGRGLSEWLRQELGKIDSITVLSPTNSKLTSSMISFEVKNRHCDDVFRELSRQGFRCRPVREAELNAVRISTHIFNTHAQCDKLIDVIRRFG